MATSYNPDKPGGYNWIFIATNDNEIIDDLTVNRNFKKLKKNFYGAKGISTKKGNNIVVDYKTITDNNIIGTITDKDLNALILDETNDTDSHRVDTYSPLTELQLAELDRIINQVISGGTRKSKKARKSRKPRKPNKNKSRKGKSRKSTSRKK
tara:strand:- start:1545 stop:2003 length:459 start_codon:yes stop_codon:yes gene_type:complete